MVTKDKRGKPPHWIWQYYKREIVQKDGKTSVYGSCNYCETRFSAHPSRMASHLLLCKNLHSSVVKTQIREKLAADIAKRPKREEETLNTISQGEAATELITESYHTFDENRQDQATMYLIQAMVTGAIPHVFIENPYFETFLSVLNPDYKRPTRQSITDRHVPDLYQMVEAAVNDEIDSVCNIALSVDGWTDTAKNAIINFMVHAKNPLHYKSIDTESNQHTGAYMANLMSAQIEEISPTKVIAIVSDHATNLQAAWKIIVDKFPWIIVIGCKGHALHLACCDLIKIAEFDVLIELCKDIAKFFSRQTPRDLLSNAQLLHYKRKFTFPLPSNVRWGSCKDLIESVHASRVAICGVLQDPRIKTSPNLEKDAKIMRGKTEEIIIWHKLETLIAILSPLTRAIDLIEGDSVDTVEASIHIEKAFKLSLQEAISTENFDQSVREEAKQVLEKRLKFCEAPIFYLARLLDPRERGASLTEDQILQGIEVLINRVLLNPRFKPFSNQVLKEIAEWRSKTGIFGHPSRLFTWNVLNTTIVQSLTWWNGYFQDTVLSKVFTALKCIPITSAANERNWSMRNRIHTPIRNRLATSTASMETYIAYYLRKIQPIQENEFSYESHQEPAEPEVTDNDENTFQYQEL